MEALTHEFCVGLVLTRTKLFIFDVAGANCGSDDLVCKQGHTHTDKTHTVPRHDRESQAPTRGTPARLSRQSTPNGLQINSLKSLSMQLVQCKNTHDQNSDTPCQERMHECMIALAHRTHTIMYWQGFE